MVNAYLQRSPSARPPVGARTTPAMDAEARRTYEESTGMCNKAVRDPPSGVRAASKVESFFCKARSYVPNVENFAAAISLLDPCAHPAHPPPPSPTFRNLSLSLPFPPFPLSTLVLFRVSRARADKERSSLRRIPRKFARYFRALRWTGISFYGAADFIVRQNCPRRILRECSTWCAEWTSGSTACNARRIAARFLRWSPWNFDHRHLAFNYPYFIKNSLTALPLPFTLEITERNLFFFRCFAINNTVLKLHFIRHLQYSKIQ